MFTIFRGKIITKTRKIVNVKVFLNRDTSRLYYTDDSLRKQGNKTVSVKVPRENLDNKWHYAYISHEKLKAEKERKPKLNFMAQAPKLKKLKN
jgi:hypothetical protein